MLQVLKNRNYVLMWLSQVISGLGDVLYLVGVLVEIFNRTGSALQTAGVMVATTAPSVVLGPLAGALADRYSRQRILVLMDVIRAFLVGVLWLMLRGDEFNLWGIYLVIAGLSSATTFYYPARQAMIPEMVPLTDIVHANSLLVGTSQATLAGGFLVGSLLVLRMPLRMLVLIDLFTFVAAAILIFLIRVKVGEKGEGVQTETHVRLFQSLRDGVAYLRQHDVAKPLVIMEIMEHIPHGIWSSAILLVFAEKALGGGASEWSSMSSAYFGGQLLGALFAAVAARFMAHRAGWFIVGSTVAFGILTVIFAVSPTLVFAVLLAVLFGPPASLRDVAQDSLLQTVVSAEMLGRVYAFRGTLMSLMFMVSGMVFAWLADVVAIRAIYLTGGGLYLITAIYAVSSRALRRSEAGSEAVLSDQDLSFRKPS